MTDYTPEQIHSLTGRDLDRAVCELVYRAKIIETDDGWTVYFEWGTVPDRLITNYSGPYGPPFSSNGELLSLFLEPGGPLEPTYLRVIKLSFTLTLDGQRVQVEEWDRSGAAVCTILASGTTDMEAVCRAACIVALWKANKT